MRDLPPGPEGTAEQMDRGGCNEEVRQLTGISHPGGGWKGRRRGGGGEGGEGAVKVLKDGRPLGAQRSAQKGSPGGRACVGHLGN